MHKLTREPEPSHRPTPPSPAAETLHLPTVATVLESLEGVTYFTDPDRHILALGGMEWQSFARENGAPNLTAPESLIGRDLFDFVYGPSVREIYARYLATLAAGERAVLRFEYRCDSPTRLRKMRMCISAVREGQSLLGFLFQSLMITEESRPPIDLFNAAAIQAEVAAHACLPIVTLCSFCHRVADRDAKPADWVAPEVYYQRGGTSQVQVSHGICPDCQARHRDVLIA